MEQPDPAMNFSGVGDTGCYWFEGKVRFAWEGVEVSPAEFMRRVGDIKLQLSAMVQERDNERLIAVDWETKAHVANRLNDRLQNALREMRAKLESAHDGGCILPLRDMVNDALGEGVIGKRKCAGCGKTWEFDCPDCAVKDRMAGYVAGAIQRSSIECNHVPDHNPETGRTYCERCGTTL